jgi:hypothetical protein
MAIENLCYDRAGQWNSQYGFCVSSRALFPVVLKPEGEEKGLKAKTKIMGGQSSAIANPLSAAAALGA